MVTTDMKSATECKKCGQELGIVLTVSYKGWKTQINGGVGLFRTKDDVEPFAVECGGCGRQTSSKRFIPYA